MKIQNKIISTVLAGIEKIVGTKKNRYDLFIVYNIHSYSPLLSLSLQAIVVYLKAYLRREEVIKSIEVVHQCELKNLDLASLWWKVPNPTDKG
jgi:hypothetical protein